MFTGFFREALDEYEHGDSVYQVWPKRCDGVIAINSQVGSRLVVRGHSKINVGISHAP
jgi:hypothetical protein